MTVELYSDKFGRKVWLDQSYGILRIDLQDLAPDFEYERSLTTTHLQSVAKALQVPQEKMFDQLVSMLKDRADCFDVFSEWLSENNISANYFSG
ncbi:hypothetical protein [Chryseobacterium sp. 5_R23647]|uniref:hypothetical protein n=1 Tax=Chryseobacterium sp. 5_R23647 TaxID=2258964 RepID=UPI000E224BD6|nr:hypothetical protein [Chryseobacterium sp. 5_R23647]REC45183.1 hypothetical protein DRF69_04755 [Chryseobacterium sp. 5_R23647]